MSQLVVGALRLGLADRRDEPGARTLVDRALHTADLPDTPGRRLLWRQIDLGVVRADTPPAALAARLAAALRASAPEAVWLLDPGAPAAAVVRAPDEPTAAGLLLVRLLSGGHAPAWPWRRAAPRWTGAADAAGLRALVGPPPSDGPSWARLAAVLDVVAHHHLLPAAVTSLPVDWWRALAGGAADAARPPPRLADDDRPLALPTRWSAVLEPRVARLASDPVAAPAPGADVTRALAALAVIVAHPGLADAPEARAAAVHALLGPPPTREAPAPPRATTPAAPTATPAAPAPPRSPLAAPPVQGARDDATRALPDPTTDPDLLPTPRTRLGGLLFLLAPLRALGLDALLDGAPEWQHRRLGEAVLRRLAERAGLPDDDGWTALLPPDGPVDGALVAPDPIAALADPEVTPRRVIGARRRAVVAGDVVLEVADGGGPPPWPEAVPDAAALFVAAVDAWCRQHLDRGVEEVARRPAALRATRTHLDVVLPLDTVDVTLRRWGLDLDPGWVPWWGRVVTFHYEERLPP